MSNCNLPQSSSTLRRAVCVMAVLMCNLGALASDFSGLGNCRFGTIATVPSASWGGGKGFGASLATDGSILVAGFVTTFNPQSPKVFRRVGDEFVPEGTLDAPAGWSLINYGLALQVSNGEIWVGAPNAPNGGAVVRYVKQADAWTLAEIIAAPAGLAGGFGTALAVKNDLLIVGAPSATVRATDAGAVQVFVHAMDAWQPAFAIHSPDPASGRGFGRSLALDGTTLAVGEPLGTTWNGAAHVFDLTETNATLTTTYVGVAAGDQFGYALALRDETLVMGAPSADMTGTNSGGVWIANRADRVWQASSLLLPPELYQQENFGRSVALNGDWLFVGAPELTNATPDPSSGTVRAFLNNGSQWKYQGLAWPETGVTNGRYGLAVASVGDTIYADWGSGTNGSVSVLAIDGPDCNGDGVPDLCSRLGSFAWHSGQVPIQAGVPVSFTVPELPPAAGPVHVITHLLGGTGAVTVSIKLNDKLLKYLAGLSGSCDYPTGPVQSTVDWSLFDYALAIEPSNPVLTFTASGLLDCSQTGGAWISVEIRYPIAGDPLDTNESLVLDVCEDCDGDGVGDAIAVAEGLVADCDQSSRPDSCEIAEQQNADCNGDGILDRCQFTDAYDDGFGNSAWGGGSKLFWLQRFQVTARTPTLGGALISWVDYTNVLQGKPVTLFVYSDPNGDGDPSDAVKLVETDTTIDSEYGAWRLVQLEPMTLGPVGTTYFIGLYAEFGQNGVYPAALDGSKPHVFHTSWLTPYVPQVDPRTVPTLESFELITTEELATQTNGSGAGCFLIRAVGVPGSGCLAGMPADLTGDGVVNSADLGVLLGAWGQSGACDLDGDGAVGSSDLAILLAAWSN